MKLLIDRASVEKHIYGRTGITIGNFVNHPARFPWNSTQWEFNVEKANQLLEQAGWQPDPQWHSHKKRQKSQARFPDID